MLSHEKPQRPFKVIVVGGSIAGLTLANALERAGIDYVLLEKREVAPNAGQGIFVLPCTSIVLEQLGVAKTLQELAIPLKQREHRDGNMNVFCSSDEFSRLYKKSQRPARFVDRFRFITSLYEGINDKSKIHSREGIVSFTETDHGVTVLTDQGNTYEGDILVGADGVHSETRRQMAAQDQDSKRSDILTKGFKTRYACLTALSHNHFAGNPKSPFLPDGLVVNTYHENEGIGTMCCVGTPGQLIWVTYIPIDQTSYPSPRFTKDDADAYVKKYGHLNVYPDCTISDVYESRIGATLVAMEENVLPTKWNSSGRVVMIGDAVHKATANLGMGGNLCVDDVCRLVNGLMPLLEQNPSPTTQELNKVFSDYETAARPRALFVNKASGIFCGFETMTSWYSGLMKWVYPWIPSSAKMMVFALFDSAAPKLDFLPVPVAKFEG
ncbi:Zeaxanthin epoxidase, chloroplastic [Cytospora mali]|uniref:Zeaxanthin epoxidase, chloroplastic n=1 Tax=Cytospora mali TaxID=578113 RepID=A0A194WD40_CYTMA|nr:Zeaxanthin epoxidase, chloroplastic [Valsa mali]